MKSGELHFSAAKNSEMECEWWEVWMIYGVGLCAGGRSCLFFGNGLSKKQSVIEQEFPAAEDGPEDIFEGLAAFFGGDGFLQFGQQSGLFGG